MVTDGPLPIFGANSATIMMPQTGRCMSEIR